ncbi:MAG: alpha/beta fold hydrolase, partial [Acidobacteria bacterium]|nr:alpha/beta fold hydrolase [Acidobacteriota bacterium]
MRTITGAAAAACIAIAFAGAFLAENALHVPDHTRSPLLYAQAFARQAGAGISAEEAQAIAPGGVRLAGWLFTPAHPNGAAAIVLHGIGDTRTGVLGQARFLLAAGYAVLTPDSRGHGASGGELTTYGVREAADIHAWADLLMSRPGIERLYGLGQSMGAAILIESLAREPRFRALAADCPFATFEEIAGDRLAQHGSPGRLISWPLIEFGMVYARIRYGVDLRRASPEDALRRSRTPVLLIHG